MNEQQKKPQLMKCHRCDLECEPIFFGMHLNQHPDAILPWLHLGHRNSSRSEIQIFQRLKIKRVLNMAAKDVVNYFDSKLAYKSVYINDNLLQTLTDGLVQECVEFIHQANLTKEPILVHCIRGVSRSATMVIAYLMKHQSMSLHEAYFYVKKRRPIIQPNQTFHLKLIELEKKWNDLVETTLPLEQVFCECQLPPHNHFLCFCKIKDKF